MKLDLKRPKLINNYEVVVLFHPDTSLEEQKEVFRKNKETLKNYTGEFYSMETWGKRNLAYPINKLKKAYFVHALFQSEPSAVAELERTMRINDKVLRFMHTRLDSRKNLAKHLEAFKSQLKISAEKEREKEAKIQARKAARAAAASSGD
ncbi:MAG: 30S ribosomal protein S6 [Deltaproteobacteria bacterium]|jgi:small subunit ribosomal protein S6|nr:30S ribosomal protein S6 [Deltaproteobacteria bacterium]